MILNSYYNWNLFGSVGVEFRIQPNVFDWNGAISRTLPLTHRCHAPLNRRVAMELLLLIVVLFLLFGGGGYFGRRRGYW
jgi:hypothetical protein